MNTKEKHQGFFFLPQVLQKHSMNTVDQESEKKQTNKKKNSLILQDVNMEESWHRNSIIICLKLK